MSAASTEPVNARPPLIVGNWKMNCTHREAIALVQKLAFSLPDKYFDAVDVAVLPPFTDIRSVQSLIHGDQLRIGFGAQDVSQHAAGAHTGEVSAGMLAALGCRYVTVGHSERREQHRESDDVVAAKARAALGEGISPIVCLGESRQVRDAGGQIEHCVAQLRAVLTGLTGQQLAAVVIAYEPVWAIGTGRVATPADAQEVCAALRQAVAADHGQQRAEGMRLLYGGSAKSSTIAELVGQTDVDGGLIGGASLDADEFAKLCAIAAGGPLP